MTTIYVRTYMKKKGKEKTIPRRFITKKSNHDLLFLFDTETTIDYFQNLKVGFFMVVQPSKKKLINAAYFYDSNHSNKKEISILRDYCKNTGLNLYTRKEFIKIYYKYVLFQRATCVGFNLPFDHAIISKNCTDSKGQRFYNGFSLILNENEAYPRIKIAAKGSKYSLIELGSCPFNQRNAFYPGRFIDLHTLALVLSGERSISLEGAGKKFKAKDVKHASEIYGVINEGFLKYLSRDVLCTYSLYEALVLELKKYGEELNPAKMYTQASLGKAILRKFNFKQFFEQNPLFPDWMLGCIMESFYGGLAIVYCRKRPTRYSLLDVTSMYPTINILTGMQNFLIAEKIEFEECTEEIQKFLTEVELKDLQDPKTYAVFPCICIIQADGDELPQRMKFNPQEQDMNIAICKSYSKIDQVYALPDLIRSKISSGKTPIIKKAYRFIPKGIQKSLKPISILNKTIDLRVQNIFKELVNERQRIKIEMKKFPKDSLEYIQLKSQSEAIKLIVNSSCYGIYSETNSEHADSLLELFGLRSFESEGFYEAPGEFYNPIMSTIITSTARLLLGTMEKLVRDEGHIPGFCDTDSLAVPPHLVSKIQEFFQPLNPYMDGIKLVNEEIHDKWFLGISTKRYCFYDLINGQVNILKYSSHGIGQYMNPFGDQEDWHKKIWETFVKIIHLKKGEEEIENIFGIKPAVAKLSISNKPMYHTIRNIGKKDDYEKHPKPFGFMCRGHGTQIDPKTKKPIRPVAPYDRDVLKLVRGKFNDAETGKNHYGREKWRTIASIMYDYIDHPESKLDGKEGFLTMKTVNIFDKVYIGKEVKNISPSDPPDIYLNREDIKKKILLMTPKEAEERGVSRPTLWKIKRKIRAGKKLNFNTHAVVKLRY